MIFTTAFLALKVLLEVMASTAGAATTKDAFLTHLLADKGNNVSKVGGSGRLVQELGPDGTVVVEDTKEETIGPSPMPPTPPVDEGPSMLEMMMAAHREAKVEKEVVVQEEVKKATKTFGSGFKKGFFGGGNSSGKTQEKTASTTAATAKQSVTKSTTTDIPTIVKPAHTTTNTKSNGTTAAIAEEVKRAMSEEESPMLKQLKQGEWVTQDLVQVFASNAIISRGLQDPKCKAAMQLMQKDPKAAQKRFEGDPDVDLFMREFGRVMASHFDGLGQQQSQQSQQSQQKQQKSMPLISEADSTSRSAGVGMGPLQTEALERHKNNTHSGSSSGNNSSSGSSGSGSSTRNNTSTGTSSGTGTGSGSGSGTSSGTGTGSGSGSGTSSGSGAGSGSGDQSSTGPSTRRGADGKTDEERDTQRVNEIVQDAELSALLLDVDMQRILQECGDSLKYRKHMSDPATAYKIKRLFEAGLVATVT